MQIEIMTESIQEFQNIYDECIKPLDSFSESKNNVFTGLEYTKIFNTQYLLFVDKINAISKKFEEGGYSKETIKSEVERLHSMIVQKSA